MILPEAIRINSQSIIIIINKIFRDTRRKRLRQREAVGSQRLAGFIVQKLLEFNNIRRLRRADSSCGRVPYRPTAIFRHLECLDGTWTRRFLREECISFQFNYGRELLVSYFLTQVLVMETSGQLLPDSGASSTSWSSPLRLLLLLLLFESLRFWISEGCDIKRNQLKLKNVLDTESIELLKVSSKFQSQKVHCYQKNACHVRNSSDLRNLLEVTVKKTSLEYKQGYYESSDLFEDDDYKVEHDSYNKDNVKSSKVLTILQLKK
uniref:Uncharacterized protein n=1 Tax=Rhizophagus irregularis (strain DAOM 181602 / DAOM 197198 / MUCL 43194) TaxID=747089 RepID=U9T611_RHIID